MLRFALAANICLAIALSGCGDNSTASTEAEHHEPPPARGIFISASDCADVHKATLEQCGAAIDQAVVAHEQTTPSYASLRSCSAALGPDRCVKGRDGKYRVQLQAFMVTMSKPASAIALYPPVTSGVVGFKSAQGPVAALDDGYTISASAQAIASDNSRLAGPTE